MDKPFSQACENNRDPILAVLQQAFAQSRRVLEIGSGTGQHAVYFAGQLPHLLWQTSDMVENHAGIQAWLQDYEGTNLLAPISLDMSIDTIPSGFDAVFSANTAHIMPWEVTRMMIARVAAALPAGGIFALYGPFNYSGEYTSPSNAAFDQWLKDIDPARGIRDFEAVVADAMDAQLMLIQDHDMPANNRLLVFGKTG